MIITGLAGLAATSILALSILNLAALLIFGSYLFDLLKEFPASAQVTAAPLLILGFYLQILGASVSIGPLLALFTSWPFMIYVSFSFPYWVSITHLIAGNRDGKFKRIIWFLALIPGVILPLPVVAAVYLIFNVALFRRSRWCAVLTMLVAVRVFCPSLTWFLPNEIPVVDSVLTVLFFFMPIYCFAQGAHQADERGSLSDLDEEAAVKRKTLP